MKYRKALGILATATLAVQLSGLINLPQVAAKETLQNDFLAELKHDEVQFQDLPVNHWAAKDIQMAVQKGYVDGYGDGTFRPESPVAHSEFTKMLVAALGTQVANVQGNSWYVPYVDAAVQQGYLTAGDKANTAWATPMSRTAVVETSLKFLGKMPANPKKAWYDATSIGLMRGNDAKGTLSEAGTLTRAEAITIIERVLALKEGKTLAADKTAVGNAEIVYHGTNAFTMLPDIFKPEDFDKVDLNAISMQGGVGNQYKAYGFKLLVVDLDNPNDPHRHYLGKGNYGMMNLELGRTAPTQGAYAFVRVRDYEIGTNPDKYTHGTGSGGLLNVGLSYAKEANFHMPLNGVGAETYYPQHTPLTTKYHDWQAVYYLKNQMSEVSAVDIYQLGIAPKGQMTENKTLYDRFVR